MIGPAIRAVRENIGLNGKELAEMLGVSAPYLSRIENNKRNASSSLLASVDMIASEHGVPSNLMGMSDVNDRTARAVHMFMMRDDVSVLRKESARALIESVLKME